MMNLRTMVVGLIDDHVAKAFMRLWEHDLWRIVIYQIRHHGMQD
jgi:hypothetical protein